MKESIPVLQEVTGININEIPAENKTIADDFNLKLIPILIDGIEFYFRSKDICPFNRGNWVIDFIFNGSVVCCIKLPAEMTKEQFEKYVFPLKSMGKKEGEQMQ